MTFKKWFREQWTLELKIYFVICFRLVKATSLHTFFVFCFLFFIIIIITFFFMLNACTLRT